MDTEEVGIYRCWQIEWEEEEVVDVDDGGDGGK